jgi:hypothetical protein
MGAEFEIVKIDPNVSGKDWFAHLNFTVKNAKRHCKYCTAIFGVIDCLGLKSHSKFVPEMSVPQSAIDNYDFGPFTISELVPLNEEAKILQKEIHNL